MFIQLFGSFLLNKGVVTPKQLIDAIEQEATSHIQLGTLAIHAGLMDAEQIEDVRIAQTHTDKRFGEICLEKGYLTENQLDMLLSEQYPMYLLLGQILEQQGVFDPQTFSDLVHEYVSENCIPEENLSNKNESSIPTLVQNYCANLASVNKDYQIEYVQLFMNNLIRFVGSDFTLLPPVIYSGSYPTQKYATQTITGSYRASVILDMTEDAAITFASRYASEPFDVFDEYAEASLEDFLNLHNGLFNVNISNIYSDELGLEPPLSGEKTDLSGGICMYKFPALFPFGMVNLVISEI